MQLAASFEQTIRDIYGRRGEQWLRDLPNLIAGCERRWSLTVAPPFPSLSYNFAAPARSHDGHDVVLKLGVPNPELTSEIEALRLYDGRGIAQLIHADAEQGALVIERLVPGQMLVSLVIERDEEATSIAAEIMRQLWQPMSANEASGLPTLARWTRSIEEVRWHFDGGTGPFDALLVDRAERLREELLASSSEPALLHGDLHHFNILTAERQPWLAIDPKGVIGDPTYETAPFLYNPMDELLTSPDVKRIVAQRIDVLCELLWLDRQRVLGWSLVQSVLSAWWSYEDKGYGWEDVMAFAGIVAEMMNK